MALQSAVNEPKDGSGSKEPSNPELEPKAWPML